MESSIPHGHIPLTYVRQDDTISHDVPIPPDGPTATLSHGSDLSQVLGSPLVLPSRTHVRSSLDAAPHDSQGTYRPPRGETSEAPRPPGLAPAQYFNVHGYPVTPMGAPQTQAFRPTHGYHPFGGPSNGGSTQSTDSASDESAEARSGLLGTAQRDEMRRRLQFSASGQQQSGQQQGASGLGAGWPALQPRTPLPHIPHRTAFQATFETHDSERTQLPPNPSLNPNPPNPNLTNPSLQETGAAGAVGGRTLNSDGLVNPASSSDPHLNLRKLNPHCRPREPSSSSDSHPNLPNPNPHCRPRESSSPSDSHPYFEPNLETPTWTPGTSSEISDADRAVTLADLERRMGALVDHSEFVLLDTGEVEAKGLVSTTGGGEVQTATRHDAQITEMSARHESIVQHLQQQMQQQQQQQQQQMQQQQQQQQQQMQIMQAQMQQMMLTQQATAPLCSTTSDFGRPQSAGGVP